MVHAWRWWRCDVAPWAQMLDCLEAIARPTRAPQVPRLVRSSRARSVTVTVERERSRWEVLLGQFSERSRNALGTLSERSSAENGSSLWRKQTSIGTRGKRERGERDKGTRGEGKRGARATRDERYRLTRGPIAGGPNG